MTRKRLTSIREFFADHENLDPDRLGHLVALMDSHPDSDFSDWDGSCTRFPAGSDDLQRAVTAMEEAISDYQGLDDDVSAPDADEARKLIRHYGDRLVRALDADLLAAGVDTQ